jgi:hypothetical protein
MRSLCDNRSEGDAQGDLGTHLDLELRQRVECLGDDAFRRVLHRDDAQGGFAALHGGEHFGDALHRDQPRVVAELLARRLVGEGALRPQVGDPYRLLEGARGGDDLAEHRRDAGVGKRPLVGTAERLHDAPLARGLVDGAPRFPLELADPLHDPGTFVEPAQDLAIDAVDALAQALETAVLVGLHLRRVRCFGLCHGACGSGRAPRFRAPDSNLGLAFQIFAALPSRAGPRAPETPLGG